MNKFLNHICTNLTFIYLNYTFKIDKNGIELTALLNMKKINKKYRL